MDLPDNSGYGDPKSWLSMEAGDAACVSSGAGGNVDPALFNDLVEMTRLVQSLIDRKESSSYTRRGSMIYTKTPSRETMSRKGRNASKTIPNKKKRDHGDKEHGKNGSGNDQDGDSHSSILSRGLAMEKESEELLLLKGQLEQLQLQISKKDELLNSAEMMQSNLEAQIEELRHQSAEKDSFIRSIQNQLSDAKIKLADKQAALEKTQWEAMTSAKRAEKLQEDLNKMQGDCSSIMSVFEGLTENATTTFCEDYDDVMAYSVNESSLIDNLDASGMERMEEARRAYIAALAILKERQDEEALALATKARLHLQSFIFGTEC